MKAFKNYNEVQAYTDSVKLPAGAYEVTIKRAEDTDQALCLLFDISEGEFSGYFMQKFESDKKNFPENARYKGVLRLWYPNGGQYDEQADRRRKTALQRIVDSNSLTVDFTKEWDGAVLKGAKVGMIFRDQEYDYKGRTGMTAQPYQIITLADLLEGRFVLPEPKRLKGTTSGGAGLISDTVIPEEDDLPF